MYDQATETPSSTVSPHHLEQGQADRQEAPLYAQANFGEPHPITNRGKDSRQDGCIPGDQYDDQRSPGEATTIIKNIVWNAEFSVGVKEMDDQHQRIIRTFNKLVDNVQAHVGSEVISEVLSEMVGYASDHFKREEQLLEDHKHPDLNRQKNGTQRVSTASR